jgi:hypothetical protein
VGRQLGASFIPTCCPIAAPLIADCERVGSWGVHMCVGPRVVSGGGVKAWIEVHMHQRRAADAYAHARAHARAHAQRVHVVHASQVRHAEHGYTYYGYMSMAIPSTAILTMATPTRRTMPTTSPSRRCGTTRTTALTTPPSSRRIRTCLGGCTTRHAAYPPLPTPPPTPTPCTHPTLHARHAPLFTPAPALTRAQLTECLQAFPS